ncbi:hypothetical protein [Xenorhabdus bovienii]|uniref:hypothetical protein n=1 Tax=Xenorhabdus bovienii TaxID=40576 RepID=UPI003DA3CAEE
MAKIIYGGAFGVKYNHLSADNDSFFVTQCGISEEYISRSRKLKTGKITCPDCIKIARIVFESCTRDELGGKWDSELDIVYCSECKSYKETLDCKICRRDRRSKM